MCSDPLSNIDAKDAALTPDNRGQPAALRSLLVELTSRLRQLSDVPLQSGVNSPAIVRSAWAGCGGIAPGIVAPRALAGELDELVRQALEASGGTRQDAALPGNSTAADGNLDDGTLKVLAHWVERVYGSVRGVHKRAIDVLALRVGGSSDREIARQLGLGLRLVQRLAGDIRAAWPSSRQIPPVAEEQPTKSG